MRAPAFWWQPGAAWQARLLAPIGAALGALAARRMEAPGSRAAVPVICVGNPVAGGAGKTPTALYVAARLRAMGHRPVFLSRGYGGRLAGPVRVDGLHHDAQAVGDEPLLLAQEGPAVVARQRVGGADLAASLGDVVVMDDGFQNPSLAKDLSLLVVDGAVGVGNGLCLPAGPLRAPLERQLARADGVLVIGPGGPGAAVAEAVQALGRPVFTGRLVPDPQLAAALKGRRVVGFAGIGRPEKFRATLEAIGAQVVGFMALGDHALPSPARARALLAEADARDALIVTTSKDMVRLAGAEGERAALRARARAVPVVLEVNEAEALDALLRAAMAGRAADQAGPSPSSRTR